MKFTKMHGLGNDFMVIDATKKSISLTADNIRSWSRRDTGIGFDQCLIIEASNNPDIDFIYRIFNADGNEVGQCGNGARCLARFIRHYGLSNKQQINVATSTTRMQLQINPDDSVTVSMGVPQWTPEAIPLIRTGQQDRYELILADGKRINVHALSVGNPHAVMLIDNLQTADVTEKGQQVSEHPLFPEQCNAGFMQIISNCYIKLRVYERGCGETRACGSGAAAAAAVGRRFYQMQKTITVNLPGGNLRIDWQGMGHPLLLTGPATFVYEGKIIS